MCASLCSSISLQLLVLTAQPLSAHLIISFLQIMFSLLLVCVVTLVFGQCNMDSQCTGVNATRTSCCVVNSGNATLTGACVTPADYSALGCSEECDACEFTNDDPSDCLVYGKLDGTIIGWSKTSQACLDSFNIKNQAVNPVTLQGMFPNSDGSDGSITSFVNFLRFDVGSVVYSIRAGFSSFFFESSPGIVTFKSQITIDGTQYSCQSSESSCWTALRGYFGEEPGATEMKQVGASLWNQERTSRELEQSLSRIRLCAVIDGSETPDDNVASICQGIYQQMVTERNRNSGLACSAFAFGPGTTDVCSRMGNGGNNENSSSRLASLSMSVVTFISLLVACLSL